MAFTIDEIRDAFSKCPEAEFSSYYSELFSQLEKTQNYSMVTGYLTGQIPVLPSLGNDYHNYYWFPVLHLLKNIIQPTAEDQLILDMIHHPDLSPALQQRYQEWLMNYVLQHKDDVSFAAAEKQFRSLGLTDDDFFSLLIYKAGPDSGWVYDELNNTALKKFLAGYLKSARNLPNTGAGYLYGHNSWSELFFRLLEDVRPDFCQEYILYSLYADTSGPLLFVTSWQNNKYLPAILGFIRNRQNPELKIIQIKFRAAFFLYENQPALYKSLVLEMAAQYLEYCLVHQAVENWSAVYHSAAGNPVKGGMNYSSWAIHVLLKYEKEKNIAKIEDYFSKKKEVSFSSISILQFHVGSVALPFIEKALLADTGGIELYRSLTGLLKDNYEPEAYIDIIWKLAGTKSKPVKELVASLVAEKDKAAEEKAIALLTHKNGETRQTAALVLSRFSTKAAFEAISALLDKEANDNARDLFLKAVAHSLPENATDEFITAMIRAAANRGKLNKPVEPWLDETLLPPLNNLKGEVLSAETVRFLLYRMSRIKEMQPETEARYIFRQIQQETAAPFALTLMKLFAEAGYKPEHKYLMATAALLGNDTVTDKIRITINKWIEENRYKIAEYGVGALALQGSNKALRTVEWYSRKFKTKKANVGQAALQALETAAAELGISIHELGDRIVPDFGFEGLFKHFTTGDETYRAFIDSNFKLAYFNEQNKKLKSLPATASAKLKEEFKTIAKEVREIVRSQSSRLEYYLITERRWTAAQWQALFLHNPVMFIYATKLLWGEYDQTGSLLSTFVCLEDTSLCNAAGDELETAPAGWISLVHPSQLNTGELQTWKQFFFDQSIEPVFPQLERKLPDLSRINISGKIIRQYEGIQMVTGSIRSTLERFGWHKGPTGDGGLLESFNLLHADAGLEAILELDGVGAGFGWTTEEKTGRLYVIDRTKEKRKWFATPQQEEDDRLVSFAALPPIFLHEMLAAIESVKKAETT